MVDNIRVLIIEDDPMVAYINREYTKKVSGFVVAGEIDFSNQVSVGKDDFKGIDLVLLDIYLPGESGISLLKKMRDFNNNSDVIIISAARQAKYINDAMKLGIIDYLIKPFSFERFKTSLLKYRKIKKNLEEKLTFNQQEVDNLMNSHDFGKKRRNNKLDQREVINKEGNSYIRNLPKGLNKDTLKLIKEFMKEENGELTTKKIAQEIDLSRVTVQRYLKYMTEEKIVKVRKKYGSIGRPKHYYKLIKD